jgi:hypothetical protein
MAFWNNQRMHNEVSLAAVQAAKENLIRLGFVELKKVKDDDLKHIQVASCNGTYEIGMIGANGPYTMSGSISRFNEDMQRCQKAGDIPAYAPVFTPAGAGANPDETRR